MRFGKNDNHRNMKAGWGMESGGPPKTVSETHAGIAMSREGKPGKGGSGNARPPQTVSETHAGLAMPRNAKPGVVGTQKTVRPDARHAKFGVDGTEPISMSRDGGTNPRPK